MQAMLSPMIGFFGQWGSFFWATLRETAPFLVLGLLLAGILHVLVPSGVILWALGHKGWRGAVRGALIGMPLPLCSCGVLPTALTLRRQGASLSAAASFTISTPETSIDALAITAALLPAIFLGVRPLAAVLLAVIVGTVVELFATNTKEELRLNVLKLSRIVDDSTKDGRGKKETSETADICRVCGLMVRSDAEHAHELGARIRAVFSYAFGTFFKDIATWVMFGLVFAALLQVLLPGGGINSIWLGRYPNLQILFAILAGVPLYSCATASTPLAAVLLTKGLNPGAALALLLAGPATNLGNIFMLKREFGSRVTAIYYATLLVCCWLMGVGFNLAWPAIQKSPALTQIIGGSAGSWVHPPDWLEIVSAWIIFSLTLNLWIRSTADRMRHGHEPHDHHGHDHHHDHVH